MTKHEAQQAGYEAARKGERATSNPCTDDALFEAWQLGFANGKVSLRSHETTFGTFTE